jgi:hypothetical protein
MASNIDDNNLFQDVLEEIESQISNDEDTNEDVIEDSDTEHDLMSDNKIDLESDNLKSDISKASVSKVTKKRVVKKNATKNKITDNSKSKGRSIIYGKNKTTQENLEVLKHNFNIVYNVDTKSNIIINKNVFKEKLKFPTFITLSKASKLNDFENFSLVIVDDQTVEYKINKIIISELEGNDKNKNLILLNMSTFATFQKVFFDLISNKINFTTLHSLIGLALISNEIIICNRFDVMNYILYLLFDKLRLLEKVSFIKKDKIDLYEINSSYSILLKEELSSIKIDNLALISFLKANKIPETTKEKVLFDVSKLINFKVQFKFEAFDGMTKLILKIIKEKDLTGFSFNSLSQALTKEYPWISEINILKHYLYIINNFNQNGQIPLFSFDTQKLTRTSVVKINKKTLNTILAFSIIVKKKYGDFWISFIPAQLFYAKDFYALDFKKIFDILVSNNVQKIISDNDNKLYLHVNKDGIITGPKNTHRLELTGMSKNVLKHFDPTISKEEFILNLINRNVPYTIKDQSIIIDDVDKAAKFLKFSNDKDNLLFDFTNIIIYNINKTDKKTMTSYDVLLKYYNEFISFNFKLFKTYFYYYIYQKISSEEIKLKIKNIIEKEKEELKTVLNQYNYPSSFDLQEKENVFETDFFNDFDISNMDITILMEQCSSYIKKKIITLYKDYIAN